MSTQPEAIRLAETLERMSLSTRWDKEAATELRRLHAANVDCFEHFNALKAERDELLEALKMAVSALERSDYIQMDGDSFDVVDEAREAIARAEAA